MVIIKATTTYQPISKVFGDDDDDVDATFPM